MDCGRCLARARACCTRRRANAYPRHAEDGGAVRTGRTERRGRTDRRGRTERGARPQRDSGESRGGRRNDRVAPRVAIDARRLRIRPCQQRHPCLEPTLTDFTPLGLVVEAPRVIIAPKNFPADTLQEFIAYLK